MFINDKIKRNLPIKDLANIYVVADFDRTLTKGNSVTSWAILANTNLLPASYVQERQTLFDFYRPIETSDTISMDAKMKYMNDWFRKHISLLIKYKTSEELFTKASADSSIMEFRNGAREFIKFLHKNNIPLIIISAGIGNFIDAFLKHNNCYFDNVYICSNKIVFKDGVASGIEQNIIHSLNKNEVSLPKIITEKLRNRKNVILLGDQINDLNMVDESKHDHVIKVGFQTDEYTIQRLSESFDIVCETSDDYTKLMNTLF